MTSPTLILEALMLDPRYDEIVEEIRALTPTAVVDQADAATDDARTVLTAAAGRLGAPGVALASPSDVPGWLRLAVLDAFTGYLTGRADTCRHNPTASSPAPVFAAAWRPGVLACGPCCAFLFSIRGDADRDATCDRCGHRCAGVDAGDPIYPAMVQIGPLIYQYGICEDCRPTVGISPQLAATLAETATVATTPRTEVVARGRPRGRRGTGRGRRPGGRR